MTNFAILSNNKVINVIVADSIEDIPGNEIAIEDNKSTKAGIGMIYDSELDNFVTVEAEE
jgi:hypothetical protein